MIVNNYTLLPANENKHLFTQSQLLFWNKLIGENETDTVLQRTNFNPQDFTKFLSNIWMAELLINEDRKLDDMKFTLVGTKLAAVYGELTNQKVIQDNGTNRMKTHMKSTHQRLLLLTQELFNRNIPLYSKAEYLEENKNYIQATGLTFPMCKNSLHTNMVLGYVEVSYRK